MGVEAQRVQQQGSGGAELAPRKAILHPTETPPVGHIVSRELCVESLSVCGNPRGEGANTFEIVLEKNSSDDARTNQTQEA